MLKIIFTSLLISFGAFALEPGTAVVPASSTLTANTLSISTTTSQTVALGANKYRRFLRVTNMQATKPIYLGLTPSTSASASIEILPNASYEPIRAPTNALYLFTFSGAASAGVISGN